MKNEPIAKRLVAISESAKEFGLVLFIGAGVNGSAHRRWGELVKQLLWDGLRTCMNNGKVIDGIINEILTEGWDCYAQASLAKVLLGERYTEVLRDRIYEPLNDSTMHVAKVAEFCRSKEVKAVVTYNYDMFLENASKTICKGRSMLPIGLSGRDQHGGKQDMLPVYHVHGLLGPPDDLQKTAGDPVVLAYDEYTASTRDACGWTVATQIHFLRSHTCLFLGTSMTDWNMLRMLEAARSSSGGPQHWYLTCDQDFDFHLGSARSKWAKLTIDAKATLLESVGVQLLCVGRRYEHVYDGLRLL